METMAKRARKALDMTQVEFAKLLETSRSTVERWERDGAEGPALALMALIVAHPAESLKVLRRLEAGDDVTPARTAPARTAPPPATPPSTAPAWPGAVSTGARPTASETRVDAPADASFSGPPPPASRPAPVEPDEVRRWGNQ